MSKSGLGRPSADDVEFPQPFAANREIDFNTEGYIRVWARAEVLSVSR